MLGGGPRPRPHSMFPTLSPLVSKTTQPPIGYQGTVSGNARNAIISGNSNDKKARSVCTSNTSPARHFAPIGSRLPRAQPTEQTCHTAIILFLAATKPLSCYCILQTSMEHQQRTHMTPSTCSVLCFAHIRLWCTVFPGLVTVSSQSHKGLSLGVWSAAKIPQQKFPGIGTDC
ncbi:hypothetical protein BS47DRAFT_1336298 [Hydnum rufescens UP504]|uniref:Uncharacterized protein n=1 Tax=Hydnum rufescens UP504 TaxID=1448309 RepID=A0A9P6B9M0_9AGAM|nr:hypothetical protein BS47DRAFT_1336298 [Hydnum rufescens UP504]